MKLVKVVMIVLFAVASSFSAQGAAVSRVVFSNIDSTDENFGTSSTADNITASAPFASGFITGSVAQKLDSISLVVSTLDSTSKTVGLYADNGGFPGTFIKFSEPTAVTSKNVYTFSFDNQTLAANTKYWALPEAGLSWFRTSPLTSAAEQNGSGFASAGDVRFSVSGWSNNAPRRAISITSTDDAGLPPPPPPPDVVPEPALTSLLCFGGIALIRRRMKK